MARQSLSEQAGILLLGQILATLSSALVPIVIVRILDKTDLGILTALLLIYTTLVLLLTAGFPAALMYYLPTRTRAERRAVTRRVTLILMLLGTVAGLLLALIPILAAVGLDLSSMLEGAEAGHARAPGGNIANYLFIFAFLPAIDLPAALLNNLLVVEQRARSAAFAALIKASGESLSILLPLWLGFDLWIALAAKVAFGYVYGGLFFYFLRDLYRGEPRTTTKVSYRELFRFSVPLGLTDIIGKLNTNVDRYLIALTFPVTLLAEYQIGAWQIPMLTTIAYTVGSVYTPRFVELFKAGRPKEAIAIWRQAALKVALIVTPCTAIFLVGAEEVIELLFTVDYLGSVLIFRMYALLTLWRVASFGNVIVAAGRPRFILEASALSMVSNVILSVFFLLTLGFVGPALGTALAFIPIVIFYCHRIAASIGLRLHEIYPLVGHLQILAIGTVASVPAILFKLSSGLDPALRLLGIAGILLVSFGILGTLTRKIEREDWRYLLRWLRLKNLR